MDQNSNHTSTCINDANTVYVDGSKESINFDGFNTSMVNVQAISLPQFIYFTFILPKMVNFSVANDG